jgi:hypothetical protein
MTPTPFATLTPFPTMFFDGTISYGDYATFTALACILLIMLIGFIAWLTITLLNRRGKA